MSCHHFTRTVKFLAILIVLIFVLPLAAVGCSSNKNLPTMEDATESPAEDNENKEKNEATTDMNIDAEQKSDDSTDSDSGSWEGKIMNYQTSIEDFTLGQSPESLVELLNRKGVEIIESNEEAMSPLVENPVKDGRNYYFHDAFLYETKDMVFFYTNKGIQHLIKVLAPKFKATGKAGVGDHIDKVFTIYGKNYIDEEDPVTGSVTYEYFDGSTYLFFVTDENKKVESWGISTMSTLGEGD